MTTRKTPIGSDDPQRDADRTMNYGKERIALYRTYGTPLEGIRTIPESPFDGRENTLFGLDIRVQFEGDELLPSFSDADNSVVVATDSMKNFVQHHLGEYNGATVEGFLEFVGSEFLDTYTHIGAVRMSADQFPFDDRLVPGEDGFEPSGLVFRVSNDESPFGEVYLTRGSNGPTIEDQTSGITGIELAKAKESSFTGYVQDEYTTLPEREDRVLYISLDIFWQYENAEDALGEAPERYVPAEQVRDIAHVLFHETYTESIQDLIYRIGQRVLERYSQLESVSFEANNRTWIEVREDLEGDARVLREPARPTGYQQFTVTRDDVDEDTS